MLGVLGAILGHLRAILGHLGAILGHLGAILGPSWGLLGPSWGYLEAFLKGMTFIEAEVPETLRMPTKNALNINLLDK